jgi:hypothetical protein
VRQKGLDEGYILMIGYKVSCTDLPSGGQEELRVVLEPDVANMFTITFAAAHVLLRALMATIGKTS